MTSPIGCSLKSQDSVHATCLSSSPLLRVTVSDFQSANRCGRLRWRWSGPGWCSPVSLSAITTLFYIKIKPVTHFGRACSLRGSCWSARALNIYLYTICTRTSHYSISFLSFLFLSSSLVCFSAHVPPWECETMWNRLLLEFFRRRRVRTRLIIFCMI